VVKRATTVLAAAGLLPVLAAAAGAAAAPRSPLPASLWATIAVCSAAAPDSTVGVVGSMPGDGVPRDRMFMSVTLQYQHRAGGAWVDVEKGVTRAWTPVGSAASTREDGWTFQLAPAARPFQVRGVVAFQWRRAGRVVQAATRVTTAGHPSPAYASPAGYTAAVCQVS